MPNSKKPDQPETRTALLAGGSGLVGRNLLSSLLDSGYYGKVISLGRRTLPVSHERLTQVTGGFDELPASLYADDYFCCLGTTIKRAGSKAEFRKVDLEYPLALARVAKANNGRFFVVTALGSNPDSLFFYNQVKGQLEQELRRLQLRELHIFRPSLLVGKREEPRFGERAAMTVANLFPFLFSGPFRAYRPIPASLVGQAMLKAALTELPGLHVHDSEDMLDGN